MKYFILLGVLLLSVLSLAQNLTFEQVIPTFPYPQKIAEFAGVDSGDSDVADVDNDGDLDIITTGYGNSDLITKLYLNDGTGNFVEDLQNVFTPMYNSAIVFTDLNGDGYPDVVVSGRPDNMFGGVEKLTEIYMNDGLGSFSSIPHSIPDLSYSAVDSGDLDNDGDMDVVICGRLSSEEGFTGVFMNDGEANFTLFQELTSAIYGTIVLEDTDGDDDLDLYLSGNVVPGITVDGVSRLHENNGDGFYTALPLGLAPCMNGSAVFFDADMDGDKDLLTNGRIENSVVRTDLHLNNGNNEFEYVEDTAFIDSELGEMAVSDIDDDGDLDVLITGIQGIIGHTKLYLNNGSGVFTETTNHLFDDLRFSSVLFGDFNSDSFEDVFISGEWLSYTNISKVYLNDGTGEFFPILNTPFADLSGDFDFADVDNDGDLDILQAGAFAASGFQTYLYLNNGNMMFSLSESSFVGVRNSTVKFSDIDQDGDPDVIISGEVDGYEPLTTRYSNDGNGNFSEVSFTNVTNIKQGDLLFLDNDADGDEDLIIAGEIENGDQFIRLFNNINGSLLADINTPFIPLSWPTLDVLDVNADGIKDVVTFGRDVFTDMSIVYTLSTDGEFQLLESSPFDPVNYPRTAIGDVDLDGDEDLILSGSIGFGANLEYVLYYYQNQNNGSFDRIDLFQGNSLSRGAVNLSDLDADGDLDLMVSGYTLSSSAGVETTYVYENDGNGNFTEVTDLPFHGIGWSYIKTADLDNDGDLDLTYCGVDINNNRIFRLFENKTICVGLFNEELGHTEREFFQLTPNPANSSVRLQSLSPELKITSYELINSTGQIIRSEKLNANQVIDISSLSSGVYFILPSSKNTSVELKPQVLIKE